MSGYGYYSEEQGGLLESLIGGRTITGGKSKGGLITGGKNNKGAGERTFKVGKGSYVPSLKWGITAIRRNEAGNKAFNNLKTSKWYEIFSKHLKNAKEEYQRYLQSEEYRKYLEGLSPEERERKLRNRAIAESRKKFRQEKLDIARLALKKLKGENIDQTIENVKNALAKEGVYNINLVRSAVKLIYKDEPDVKLTDEDLKKIKYGKGRIPKELTEFRKYMKKNPGKPGVEYEKVINSSEVKQYIEDKVKEYREKLKEAIVEKAAEAAEAAKAAEVPEEPKKAAEVPEELVTEEIVERIIRKPRTRGRRKKVEETPAVEGTGLKLRKK